MKRKQRFTVIAGGASDQTRESSFIRACRELERLKPRAAGTVHEMVAIMLEPRRPSRRRAGQSDSPFILDCLTLERMKPGAGELLEPFVAGWALLARLPLEQGGKVHEP